MSRASLRKGRKPKLNATPHPPHHQEDKLEVRASFHVEAVCPKVGSVPLQEELSKCNFGGYWDVCRELAYSSGAPG